MSDQPLIDGALMSRPQSTKTTRMFVEATFPILIAAIGLPLIGTIYLIATGSMQHVGPMTTAQALFFRVVQAVPAVLMAFAMIALRKVLVEYERGQFLSSVATTSFKRVGYFALAAILVKVVGVPAARAAMLGDWRPLLGYDTFDVSLLLFGALLAMVGTAFATAAAAIKAENDEIV